MMTKNEFENEFWSKIEILENIEIIRILVKNKFLPTKLNFGQTLKFWTKIEILVKNRSFGQKSKYG